MIEWKSSGATNGADLLSSQKTKLCPRISLRECLLNPAFKFPTREASRAARASRQAGSRRACKPPRARVVGVNDDVGAGRPAPHFLIKIVS